MFHRDKPVAVNQRLAFEKKERLKAGGNEKLSWLTAEGKVRG
jgi:hypothetical protein